MRDGPKVRTADAGVSNLEIVPLSTEGLTVNVASAREKPEPLGWKVGATAEPETTVQHLKSGSTIVQFWTVLAPLKPGEERRIASAIVRSETCTVELSDGRHALISVPTDPMRDLEGRWR